MNLKKCIFSFLCLICIKIYLRDTSFPYISGDSFRAISDHIYDETDRTLSFNSVKERDIVFVKTDYLDEFFNDIHPNIKCRYILITHNSDYSAPGVYERFLNDNKIIKWFGMNPSSNHIKFISIPIGIANQYWDHGKIDSFTNIIKQLRPGNKRHNLLALSFNTHTNFKVRKPLFDKFSKVPYCVNILSNSHIDYLNSLTKSKFVLSPEGNNLDCHRTWESLLMGAIPIVLKSNLDSLFIDLPVLIIDNWDQINKEFLNNKFTEFHLKIFNYQKLFFSYWFKLIEYYKYNE